MDRGSESSAYQQEGIGDSLAVPLWNDLEQGQGFQFMMDNTTAVQCLMKKCLCHSLPLLETTDLILTKATLKKLFIQPFFMCEVCNIWADVLSRSWTMSSKMTLGTVAFEWVLFL